MTRVASLRALIVFAFSFMALVGPGVVAVDAAQTSTVWGLGGTSFAGGYPNAAGACQHGAPGTITYSASGTVKGAYPGTFTENGSVSVDGEDNMLSLSSTFTITSPNGTVTGTRWLDPYVHSPNTDSGSCTRLWSGAVQYSVTGWNIRYEATITLPDGRVCTNSGFSLLGLLQGSSALPDRFSSNFYNDVTKLPPACTGGEVDDTSPVLTVPGDIVVPATGPGGAEVTFDASAADDVDGVIPVTCDPASGSTFSLGTTTVTCQAADSAGNSGEAAFAVTVQDEAAPLVSVPADIAVEAESGAGTAVAFDASAVDDVDGALAATCDWQSGSTFPIGATSVTCSATDNAGNIGYGSFFVTVADTMAPEILSPGDLAVEAAGPEGAVVEFGVSAVDLVDADVSVSCDMPSGSLFPLGATLVSCAATDNAGNAGHASFSVTVQDTTAPEIVSPGDQFAEAIGPEGASVEFAVSAFDTVDADVTLTCDSASGGIFPVGTTTVGCTATDDAGNTSAASFAVTVVDTMAPVITTPGDIVAQAISGDGVAVSFVATAWDSVGGDVPVTCDPVSGSLFPVGSTTVTCQAVDSAGNGATGSFLVTVSAPEGPGNSAPAHACQQGGWETLAPVENPAVPFANQGECVRYGAQGGTIVPLQAP